MFQPTGALKVAFAVALITENGHAIPTPQSIRSVLVLRGGTDETAAAPSAGGDGQVEEIETAPVAFLERSDQKHGNAPPSVKKIDDSSMRSIVRVSLRTMQSTASEARNMLVRMKRGLSVDALRAKTAALSGRAILTQTALLLGSEQRPLTPLSLLSLSLLGSSLGFQSYLWFATIGYGAAVGLMSFAALLVYNTLPKNPIPMLANLHTFLVVMWSIRLTLFLLYREFVMWPDLHSKTIEADIHNEGKLGVWVTCASFYAAMVAPCCFRLQSGIDNRKAKFGVVGKTGLAFQFIGLFLESAADAQKATFKVKNRDSWCNLGLWGFFSHPNYLGEVLFWLGTYAAGVGCYSSTYQYAISTIGLIFIAFIIKSATEALNSQGLRRYGKDDEYLEFRKTHSFLGPFPFSTQKKENQIQV